MNTSDQSQPSISANLTAQDISGQVVVGNQNTLSQQIGPSPESIVTPAELEDLRQQFQQLKQQIQAEASPDKQAAALERVEELEAAITAEKPDLTTIQYVKNWFGKHLPKLTGTLTSIVVNPIVGKLVEAAGEMAAVDFRDRFGRS
jgi:hypothetical protein